MLPTTTSRLEAITRTKKRKRDDDWVLPWSLPPARAIHQTSEDFMNELGSLKNGMNIPLPWESPHIQAGGTFPLPTPIISLNLPKSATLTLYEYFKCGGYTSTHTFVHPREGEFRQIRIGDCMRDNFLSDAPPFRGCDFDNNTLQAYDFYSDVGIQLRKHCFYSSIHDGGLENIAKYYPNATIVMMPREFDAWYGSIRSWGEGRLLKSWRRECGMTGSTGSCSPEDEPCWRDFYHAHTEKVREFVARHPHLTYIEVLLDKSGPSMLERYTGIPATCMQHCRPVGRKQIENMTADEVRKHKKCKPLQNEEEVEVQDNR